MSLTVIKLGGSLMGSSELPLWLNSIELASEESNLVIVPGGGKFADSIRDLQNRYQFNDLAAHQMALLAMCQYGYYLSALNPQLRIIKNHADLTENMGKQLPLLWLPYSLIEDDSEIEASWDVTSDSIALWLATKLSAVKLILVKSIELNSDRKQVAKHIKNNNLDKSFQRLIEKYSGELLLYSKGQYSQF